jgi:4'-phosphopantetheinyl transferase
VAESWPALAPDEIHLWFAPLEVEAARLGQLAACLNDVERARAARFVFDVHRRRYAAGRGLLREMLGRYLHMPSEKLEFDLGPLGKPYLRRTDGRPRLQFNYSDANGRALFGFTLDVELGVDLEPLARELRHREIAHRHFHADEVAALERVDDTRAGADFLACWTRKEAWGKAKGVGIRYPLDSVDLCSAIASDTLTIEDPGQLKRWQLSQLRPAPEYIGAVVYEGDERRLRTFSYQA